MNILGYYFEMHTYDIIVLIIVRGERSRYTYKIYLFYTYKLIHNNAYAYKNSKNLNKQNF